MTYLVELICLLAILEIMQIINEVFSSNHNYIFEILDTVLILSVSTIYMYLWLADARTRKLYNFLKIFYLQ